MKPERQRERPAKERKKERKKETKEKKEKKEKKERKKRKRIKKKQEKKERKEKKEQKEKKEKKEKKENKENEKDTERDSGSGLSAQEGRKAERLRERNGILCLNAADPTPSIGGEATQRRRETKKETGEQPEKGVSQSSNAQRAQ